MWVTTVTYEDDKATLGETYHRIDPVAVLKLQGEARTAQVPLLCGKVFERTGSRDKNTVVDIIHDEEQFQTAEKCAVCEERSYLADRSVQEILKEAHGAAVEIPEEGQ